MTFPNEKENRRVFEVSTPCDFFDTLHIVHTKRYNKSGSTCLGNGLPAKSFFLVLCLGPDHCEPVNS